MSPAKKPDSRLANVGSGYRVLERDSIRIEDLAGELEVSLMTIRRDP